MQKKIIAAAAFAALTSSVSVMAQSNVQLYGIVDNAVRVTNNEGANRGNVTKMVGGGMSQSRWGINVTEDLGNGTKALVNLENRINADDGSVSTPFFQQAWVGVQGGFGRLTLGRQFNPLFDLVTSTYASFPYSPYMDAYKPEVGMSLGARASNAIKYSIAAGGFAGSLFYSFDEGNTLQDTATISAQGAMRSAGGFAKYSANGFSVGAGYLGVKLPAGSKLDAWTAGASYRKDKLYVNLGYGQNKLKAASVTAPASYVDAGILNAYWGGGTNGGFAASPSAVVNGTRYFDLASSATKRTMYKVGFGYQIAPKINAGIHYYHAKQSGSVVSLLNGKTQFIVAAVDYAFSKRTDAYFAVDHTKISGGQLIVLDAESNARKRTGITAGLRHRF